MLKLYPSILNGKIKNIAVNGKSVCIEYTSGTKHWYLNGQLHREDGPACEWADGDKYWYINDQRHRENGPAGEYADGAKFWYLKGKCLTEEEFTKATKRNNSNGTA